MMSAPAVHIKRWTRREYDRMAEAGLFGPDERVELLEGEIITVTPQQSPHSACIGLIDGVLRQAFGPSY
jgi:Uma2 family endonuclease